MDEHGAPTPLREILNSLDWSSPERLVRRVNQRRACRGSTPLHIKSGYPWMRGRPPSRDVMTDVLAVLSEHTGRPVTHADLGWDGPRTRPRRHLANPCEAPADALLHEIQGEPMERRSFAQLAGVAVTAPALDLLMSGPAHAVAEAAEATEGDRVSPRLAERIDQAVREARELDDTEGSSGLLWAGGVWQNIGKVILNSRKSSTTSQLHTSYVEMCETYGWMLYDSGHHAQAQRVYQTGLRLARESDSTTGLHRATANLLASAAYQASWLGQHEEAATMLSVAHTREPLTPRLRAVLADREIFAAGQRCDPDSLWRAVDQAHEQLQNATDDGNEPWWSLWLSHESLESTTGRAWLALKRPAIAEPYLARRMAAASDAYPRDRMLAAADLGTARHQAGDLEGATTAAGQAIDLAQQVSSQRVHDRLNTLLDQLNRHHGQHPHVRDLVERRRQGS